MGTTFVTLSRETSGKDPGFWMRDGMLELWLRLLALHLPEPTDGGEHQATLKIRNQWLLASRGYFVGCVPHGMEDACATQEGRAVVRMAVDSLLAALQQTKVPLDAATLNPDVQPEPESGQAAESESRAEAWPAAESES